MQLTILIHLVQKHWSLSCTPKCIIPCVMLNGVNEGHLAVVNLVLNLTHQYL